MALPASHAGDGGDLDALVAGAARGEPSAWIGVFDRLVESVYSHAYASVRAHRAAEVLTEQAFLHGWDHLRSGSWPTQGILQRLCEQVDALLGREVARV